MAEKRKSARTNRLLALLPEPARNRVLHDSALVSLPAHKELYADKSSIDAIYFPLNCVIGILVSAGEDARVEMAVIGNEGVAGVFSMLNERRATDNYVVQLPGDALRLDVRRFTRYAERNAGFRKLMNQYMFAFIRQIVQSGACNQLHTAEERCARWLLMTHDRACSDTFPLTQEFLAEKLAVRRATVNLALSVMKAAGVIRYARGQMTIADRPGLESASCPCYEIIRIEYASLGLK